MSEIMWAIKHPNWGFYYGTYPTRSQAILAFVEDMGHDWRYWRKEGNRAVKVRLEEVSDEKPTDS